ncbi:bacterial extracellular solute-binding protein [Synechococcus sp. BMK-MC-1]|nr:bacterial extracellular solute-binding protein [Synechococcus sp. BMK-MC-1]
MGHARKAENGQHKMAPASRPSIVNLRTAAGLLLVALALSSCSALSTSTPVMLYVAMVVGKDDRISSDTQKDARQRVDLIVSNFQKLYPNVQVQLALYRRSMLMAELRSRSEADLGPDLVLTDAQQAKALLREGLTDPLPQTERSREQTNPGILKHVRLKDGRLAGQPLVVYPQIACFNTEALESPPQTLNELLQVGAAGARVGLSVAMNDVLWTAGSLNALPALATASRNQDLSTGERDRITGWLTWLQQASDQRNLTFFENQGQLTTLLGNRELDWISCTSDMILRLKDRLGDDLGIAPLPSGPDGSAAPMNLLRVLALGKDSSAHQRSMAIALSDYVTNPLLQRNLSLLSTSFVPVNPDVIIAAKSSKNLAALELALKDSDIHGDNLAAIKGDGPTTKTMTNLLIPLVFGVSQPQTTADELISRLSQGS